VDKDSKEEEGEEVTGDLKDKLLVSL